MELVTTPHQRCSRRPFRLGPGRPRAREGHVTRSCPVWGQSSVLQSWYRLRLFPANSRQFTPNPLFSKVVKYLELDFNRTFLVSLQRQRPERVKISRFMDRVVCRLQQRTAPGPFRTDSLHLYPPRSAQVVASLSFFPTDFRGWWCRNRSEPQT